MTHRDELARDGRTANDDLVLIHAKAIAVLRRLELAGTSQVDAKRRCRTVATRRLANLRKLYAAVLARRNALRLAWQACI